ncbi:MAG: heavy metal-associated domain-containing protein [Flavobacteriales bacterium]
MRTPITLATFMLALCTLAQATDPATADKGKKTETLAIQSSTVCDMCVQTIESNLIYEKGVKKVTVDLATSTVNVEYDARKTTPDALRTALTMLGYAADGVPGDAKAFAKLPACCQKEGCGKLPAKQ